jgi:hypothetical protein
VYHIIKIHCLRINCKERVHAESKNKKKKIEKARNSKEKINLWNSKIAVFLNNLFLFER